MKLDADCQNTWCPGCGNFGILQALKQAVEVLNKKGIAPEDIVLTAGIGCHAKTIDYLNLNSFYGLHGRGIAVAQGVKIGNPKLKIIALAGDGDAYNEGISHLIHAAKRNIDIAVLIHNNRTFALTAGQFTATSPRGFKGVSSPQGSNEDPFNPLKLMLASKASFIARAYSAKSEHLRDLIVKAVEHQGFSFIDILQPCVSFFNTCQFYNQRVYEVEESDLTSEKRALEKIQEWEYDDKETCKIPLGLFYQIQRPVYEQGAVGSAVFRGRKKINFL